MRPSTAQAAHLWNLAPVTAETEQVQDILDILATNEAFGVTLVATVLDSAKNGAYSPAIPDQVLKILTGVRAEEQFHLDFLKGAGGKLRTDTFHIMDPTIFANPMALFKDLVELEDAAIAAVMASMHTFTREQRIDLLKANFQFATEEAEHRLLANRALGSGPRTTTPSRLRSSAQSLSSTPPSRRKGSSAAAGCRLSILGQAPSIRPA